MILADTKFEFGLDADGELVVGDEVLTPDSSRFWPADGYEAGRAQPSFDKQYVRDWAVGSGWDKTPPAPGDPRRRRRGHARALRRGLRADHRRAVRRLARRGRRRAVTRARVLVRPKAGHPRPAGRRRRAGAAGARLRGRRQRPRRPADRARRRGPGAARRDVREAARQPADRGLRDRLDARLIAVSFGVIRFPGSCDEVDALLAARARRRGASSSGTATATCRASTRSSSPAASPTATTCASARSRASRR